MIFDTHAHYDDEAFEEDRDTVIASLKGAGIGGFINVAAAPESLEATCRLTEVYPQCYGALGLHPDNVGWLTEERLGRLEEMLSSPKIVAVGEIGLDYHWNIEPKEVQKEWFRAQLAIARRAGKPVIIHSRDAAADTMEMIRSEDVGSIGGVLHCYAYSAEQAREYAQMGLSFGIGGTVTFRNAKKVQAVVSELPLSQIVLETDCPYLAPEPHRGTRNTSANLPLVAAKIAELKGITAEEVIETTERNAYRLFGISQKAEES